MDQKLIEPEMVKLILENIENPLEITCVRKNFWNGTSTTQKIVLQTKNLLHEIKLSVFQDKLPTEQQTVYRMEENLVQLHRRQVLIFRTYKE